MLSAGTLHLRAYAPLSAMMPHSHERASLGMIVDGDFAEQVGRSERHYAAGYATFSPAGVSHAQQFGNSGARQIVIDVQEAWLSYLAGAKVPLNDSPFAAAPVFRQLGRKLLHEVGSDDDFAPLAREGIVLEIVAAFGREGTAQFFGKPPAWLEAVREFLHANALSVPTMKQIAGAAGRHEIHLAREFRRYFGTSAGSYLRRLKAEEAARQLLHSGESITGIALGCGFASHSHLCRVFKAHFGVTPVQYRKGG